MRVLSPKLTAYQARASEFDTVFIGTSRTFYHIVPDDLETAVEAAGCPRPNVFNFGVFGLTGAEQDWLVERVLEAGEGALRTVRDIFTVRQTMPRYQAAFPRFQSLR